MTVIYRDRNKPDRAGSWYDNELEFEFWRKHRHRIRGTQTIQRMSVAKFCLILISQWWRSVLTVYIRFIVASTVECDWMMCGRISQSVLANSKRYKKKRDVHEKYLLFLPIFNYLHHLEIFTFSQTDEVIVRGSKSVWFWIDEINRCLELVQIDFEASNELVNYFWKCFWIVICNFWHNFLEF